MESIRAFFFVGSTLWLGICCRYAVLGFYWVPWRFETENGSTWQFCDCDPIWDGDISDPFKMAVGDLQRIGGWKDHGLKSPLPPIFVHRVQAQDDLESNSMNRPGSHKSCVIMFAHTVAGPTFSLKGQDGLVSSYNFGKVLKLNTCSWNGSKLGDRKATTQKSWGVIGVTK